MNADERRLELNRVTKRIIGCAFVVGNTLGVATGLTLGLLINFGTPKLEVKRVVKNF